MELWSRYKDWVRKNGNILSVVETGISSLTWILPDRFTDNEVSLEAVHTAINLLSAFHDSIIANAAQGAPRLAVELKFALGALQQVEVLVELWGLWAQSTQRIASRYDPLIALEGLKALVRLAILYCTPARMVLGGGAVNFERCAPSVDGFSSNDRAQVVFAAFAAFRDQHCSLSEQDASAWREAEGEHAGPSAGHSEGRGPRPNAAPPLHALPELEHWAAVQQADAARLIIAAEVLHVLRPLAYVLALRHWGSASWKPWAVSLIGEVLSGRATAAGAAASHRAAAQAAQHPAVAGTSLSVLYGMQAVRWRREELDELTRRKLLLLYYLVRDPFFGQFTRPVIERWRARLARLPLLGWLLDKAVAVLVGAQKYYSYTAAS